MIGKQFSIFAVSAFPTTLFAQCPSPGIWKPADQSVRGVVEKQGANLHWTVTDVKPDGSPWILNFTVPIKGGVGQVYESTGRFDSVTSKVVSPLVRDNTFTRGGKKVRFDHIECSKDGKTFTGTESGIDIHGKPFHGTIVVTKQ
jgi:hypothetical protein